MDLDTPEPLPSTLRYRVEGMDCPSCASTIETPVTRLGGASDVRVSYQRQVLALTLDETMTPRGSQEQKVRDLGYRISVPNAPVVETSVPGIDVVPLRQCFLGDRKVRLAAPIGFLMATGFLISQASPAAGHWGICRRNCSVWCSSAARRWPQSGPACPSASKC